MKCGVRPHGAVRLATAGLLALALVPAHALGDASTRPSKTARTHGVAFERGTVSIGDTVQQVHRIAGTPDRIVPWPVPSGPPYEPHEYFFKDRSVVITVREGRVTGHSDNHIVQRP